MPPYISAFANNVNELYHTRLEALKSINHLISGITEDYVVMSDCNVICNVDFKAMIDDHIKNGADMTIAVKRMYVTPEMAKTNEIIYSDVTGRITDIETVPRDVAGEADVDMNIIVVGRRYLQELVLDAVAHDYKSMSTDVILKNLGRRNFRIYRYDGYAATISSMSEYFAHSMELIENSKKYDSLFNVFERPIFTKVRNSPPTYYSETASVKNSLIADGCVIDGEVENCILFRGVRIGKGAVVKNSILFQDTFVSQNVSMNCVVTDKNVVVHDGVTLAGVPTLPFYIDKGKMI